MKWKNVRQILVREVRDQMRDRRTLFMIFVLPLMLYPLLGMSLFQVTQFIREQPTRVLMVGFQAPTDFPKLIRTDSDGTQHFADELFSKAESVRLLHLELQSNDDSNEAAKAAARKAVQDGNYEVVVFFPTDFNAKLQEFRKQLRTSEGEEKQAAGLKPRLQIPSPEVFYNTAKEKSQLAYVRLNEVLDKWIDAIGRQNLASRNLPETTAKPFFYANNDVAEEGQRDAALWSKILPFLLLIWALTGAFYPAIDLCAGEKERGTLETLLSSPAERGEIVWGKLLTVMLFSVVTAVLNILSMGITGSIALSQLPNFGPPPPLAPIWLFVALLPMSAMFSALCIALASIARSTKEGQYYLMPLVLVTMPLVILPMAPGVELNLGMSLIPVSGVVLILKMMLEGHYWEVLRFILPVTAVTGSCCLLAIRWAIDQFNSENVLFRESERGGIGIWFRHLLRDREDTPTVAGSVFCGVLILTVYFFMSFALRMTPDFAGFMKTAVATQLVVIFLPAMFMTLLCVRSPKQTLLLTRPRLWSIPAGVALAFALHPTALLLNRLLQLLYPPNPDLLENLEKIGNFLDNPSPWAPWITFAVMACLPAVCEELAFRGFILSGLRRLGHPWRAIILASIFFGAGHGIAVQQAIAAGLLGLVIGYIAVQSGSIFPGMAFHVAHNGLVIFLGSWVSGLLLKHRQWSWVAEVVTDKHGASTVTGYHPFIVAAGIILAGALLRWFARQPHQLSYEEELQEAIRERRERVPA